MSVRDGIEQTLAEYALGYDEPDFDRLAGCFTEEAVIFFPLRDLLVVRGRDAIRAQLAGQQAERGDRSEQARHGIMNLFVADESPSEAVAVSYFLVIASSPEGTRVSSGWYHDRLVERDGRWLFKERTIVGDAGGRSSTLSALSPPPIPPA